MVNRSTQGKWAVLKLAEVCTIQTGKYDANHAKAEGKYRFYTCAFDYSYCDTNKFKGASLILPGNGANVGEVFYYDGEFDAYQRTYVLNEIKTYPKYLYYHMLFLWKKRNQDKQYGSATNYIRMGNFTDYELPVPPFEVQQAIVSKIEELFSELDKGIESLRLAQQQLKTYRQSVLKWAFEGKLTRANEDVPGNGLEPHSMVAEEQSADEGKLPKGWKWVKFGEVHKIKSNLVNPADFKDLPHIAPDNISKGSAKLLPFRTIGDDKVFSPKHKFYKGQILYSKIRPNLAKVIIAPFDGLCSADMYPIDSDYNNRYSLYFMLTEFFISKASNTESRTILPKINQKGLAEIPFPLCGLQEQGQIVSEIESRFSVADKMEESINQSLLQAEALRQSVLKKAFEGEPV